nr:hypothetical protein [uncultured Flavobacterium sp.]
MKLTTEQIECINQTLVKKGVKFDDLKMEVLDHIASQIEYEMATTQKTFPETYNQVFERWNTEFEPTRAFFSLRTYYPKLARSKFGNQIKLEIFTTITIAAVLFFSFQLVSDSNTKLQFIFWIKKVFFYAYIGTILSMFIFKFFNVKSKVSSTYKHSFDARFPSIFIWLTLIFNDNIPQDATNQNLFVLSMGCLFMYLLSTVYLGFKHYQFQKKFSIQ